MEDNEHPSEFSILKDSLADLNSMLYSEVSQAIPSIGGSNGDDDDDSSDSGSIDIVFSGRGTTASAAPDVPNPTVHRAAPDPKAFSAPIAFVEPTAPPPAATKGREEGAPLFGSKRVPEQGAPKVTEVLVGASQDPDERADAAAYEDSPGDEEEQEEEEEEPNKEDRGDGWLSGADWTMEGWLSGAAGRLASGRKLDREPQEPLGAEEQQLRDAAAEAEAEGSFLELMARPEEEVVAEALADSGISGGPRVDLESAVSGIDLDGLLQRLRRDGHGAPATGDHEGLTLEWDLPPAESLFSDDEDNKQEQQGTTKRRGPPVVPPAPPGPEAQQQQQQQGKTSPKARRRRIDKQQPAPGASAAAAAAPDAAAEVVLDETLAPSRPAPATVVLDLRAAQGEGDGDNDGNSSDEGGAAGQGEAGGDDMSSSSDSEEDLEAFYASRRRRGGAQHQETEKEDDDDDEEEEEEEGRKQREEARGGSPWGRRGRGRGRAPRGAGGGRGAPVSGPDSKGKAEEKKEKEKGVKVALEPERVPVEQQLAQLEREMEQEEREQEEEAKQKEEERRLAAEQRLRAEEAERERRRQEQAEKRREAQSLQRRQAEEEAARQAQERREKEDRERAKREADQLEKEQQRKAAQEAEHKAAAKKAADFQLAMQRRERDRKAAWLAAVEGRCPEGCASVTHKDLLFAPPVSWIPVGEALSDFAFLLALRPAEDAAALPAVVDWIVRQRLKKGASEHPFSLVTMALLPRLPPSVSWASAAGGLDAPEKVGDGDGGPPFLLVACRAASLSAIQASGMGGFLAGLGRSLQAEAEAPGSPVAGCLAADSLEILVAPGFLGSLDLSFYPVLPKGVPSGTGAASWWDSATVAVIQQDVFAAPGRASAALEAAARAGLHVAGMRVVYLSSDQAKELAHRTRHHPPPMKPLLALLLRGTDAAVRWNAAVGPSDPRLAAAVEPGSLQGALAATAAPGLLGSQQHQAPLVTGSRDPASAHLEAALFFGGRLFPCPAEPPKPDWAPRADRLPLVQPAPASRLWVLAPASTDREMDGALKLMEELGRRGLSVQQLRRVSLPRELLEASCASTAASNWPEGREWWQDYDAEASSGVIAACLAAEGASMWGHSAVKSAAESCAGVCGASSVLRGVTAVVCDSFATQPPSRSPGPGPLHALQQLCERSGGPSGSHPPSPPGAAEESGPKEASDAEQLAIVALSAQSLEKAASDLQELLQLYGSAPDGNGDEDLEDLAALPPPPPLQLLALRRIPGLKEPLRGCFRAPEAGRTASARMRHPVLLGVLRGIGAADFLAGASNSLTASAEHRHETTALLGVCSGPRAAPAVLSAFFDDSDFAAEQVKAARSLPRCGGGALESLMMPTPEEETVVAVDVAAEGGRGILERILKLAAKHGFSVEDMGTVEVTDSEAVLPPAVAWRWDHPTEAASAPPAPPLVAVAVVLRRVGATQGLLKLLARSGLLRHESTAGASEVRAAEVPSGAGAAASPSRFLVGRGVVAQAGGPLPAALVRSLRDRRIRAAALGAAAHQSGGPSAKSPQLSPTGLRQTSCLVLLPAMAGGEEQQPEEPSATMDLGGVAETLRTVHDQGFQIESACLADFSPKIAAVHKGHADAKLIAAASALPGGGKRMLVLGLSRDNAIGKLQMVAAQAAAALASSSQPLHAGGGFGGHEMLWCQLAAVIMRLPKRGLVTMAMPTSTSPASPWLDGV